MPRDLHASLLKPFVALATPGMYLFYKYNQYKRQQQEQNRRKVTERELQHLNHKIDKLLAKLEEHEPELATSQDEECVVCISAKASMQTYPCGHKVVCRKCFVKTIQMAVSQRSLPLRCVVCRAKILRLKQSTTGSSSSNCSTRSLSQSTSNSSQLSAYSTMTSSSSSSSSSTSSSSSSSSSTLTSSTQSCNVPHGCGSQRCQMDPSSATNNTTNTTSTRKVKLLSQYHQRHKQNTDEYDDNDDDDDDDTVSIRKLSSGVLPHRRSSRSNSQKQPLLRSQPSSGQTTTPITDPASGLIQKCQHGNKKETGKDNCPVKSNRQSMTIKDYIVSSPDIIYFKSPKKDKILGNRRNLLKPTHKLPSLPKVTVRSRTSYKYLKKFETIME